MKKLKYPIGTIFDETVPDKLKIIGNTYNRLTCKKVVGYKEEPSNTKRVIYLYQCSCGNEHVANAKDVVYGKIKSCGCYHSETSKKLGLANANKPRTNKTAFSKYYNNYKGSAKSRKLVFELTKEQFKQITQQDCHYCGCPPSNPYGENFKTEVQLPYISNGIDRKDNKIGYTLENSLPACWNCNFAKWNRSYDDFLKWINRLIKYQTTIGK